MKSLTSEQLCNQLVLRPQLTSQPLNFIFWFLLLGHLLADNLFMALFKSQKGHLYLPQINLGCFEFLAHAPLAGHPHQVNAVPQTGLKCLKSLADLYLLET